MMKKFVEGFTQTQEMLKKHLLGLTLEDIPVSASGEEEGLKVHGLLDYVHFVDQMQTIMPEMDSLLINNFFKSRRQLARP